MPKGGARVNSGPPPNPMAARRERTTDRDGWTLLPAAGFAGDVPRWPLSQRIEADPARPRRQATVSRRERLHWAAAWRTPQAHVWDRLGWAHEVALYCRFLALAELGDLRAATETRQWSDRLGLNAAAMLRNRWRVTTDELGARRETQAPAAAPAAAVTAAPQTRRLRAAGNGSA